MSRITRINFAGFALTAALLTMTFAMSLFAMGCGPAPVPRPVPPPVTNPQGFVQPGAVPHVNTTVQVNDVSGFNTAQLNGLMGTYSGSFPVWYDEVQVQQPYTLVLGTATAPSAPGKTFIQATLNATGTGVGFTTLVQINMAAAAWDSTGPRYVFTSPKFSAPAFNSNGPVIFQLQATVNQNTNLFDPTPAPIINIVDGVFLQAVVDFQVYDDLQKHP